MRYPVSELLVVAMLTTAAGCGPTKIQAYDGPQMPAEEVTVLWSNPHLEIDVDRRHSVKKDAAAKLHRIELPAGHHSVEVRCLYTDDVKYHTNEGEGPAPTATEAKFEMSPTIALVMDGEAGHAYKPRVHFQRNASGVPGCKVKMFDVTAEGGGGGDNFY